MQSGGLYWTFGTNYIKWCNPVEFSDHIEETYVTHCTLVGFSKYFEESMQHGSTYWCGLANISIKKAYGMVEFSEQLEESRQNDAICI